MQDASKNLSHLPQNGLDALWDKKNGIIDDGYREHNYIDIEHELNRRFAVFRTISMIVKCFCAPRTGDHR